jgi:hypothetical protein
MHGIGIAWLQEPSGGDMMRGLTISDLEDGCAPLADVGARVMVA